MNEDIRLEKINELYMTVYAEKSILCELEDHFSYYASGYKFMPQYKNGIWDGKIKLFRIGLRKIYTGLIHDLIKFCDKYGYTYSIDSNLSPLPFLPELKAFVKNIPSISNLTPYSYQISAFIGAIVENKSLILSPTASGKSLIFYLIIQFLLEHTEGKILLVVPTVSLVEQGIKDMQSYDPSGSIDAQCHKIYAGMSKESTCRVFCTTWQSVFRLPKEWFDKFDSVIIDEAHQADASSLSGIIEKMPDAIFRVGLTGTLDGSKTHELFMRGVFGKVIRTTSTAKLMEEGKLSTLFVKIIHIFYPKEECKIIRKMSYKDEVTYLTQNEKRNDLLIELSLAQEGNVLLLFNYVESHGCVLFDKAKKLAESSGRQLFFVSGDTPVEERERIRGLVEEHHNITIYASYGVFSTGVNLKNLKTVIFGHPFKSRIRNLQSIGRGLRLAEGKTGALLIDICDDLTYNNRHNLVYNHAIERIKIYESEKFRYRIEERRF